MGELNKQFEALPLIYQLMDDSFVFVEATQEYTRKNHTEHRLVIATVNGAWYAFQEQQSKIEQLEKIITARDSQLTGEIAISTKWISEYLRMAKEKAEVIHLVKGLRNEFDLWSDDGEGFDAIEAQIELLEEALRGECE